MVYRLFKDLRVHTLIGGMILSKLHYIVLLFLTFRFFSSSNYPTPLDRILIGYILLFALVKAHKKKKKIEQSQQLAEKARAKRKSS